MESEPPYQYVGGNPINRVDSSGKAQEYPPYFSSEEAEAIQTLLLPWLFDSASRHNMPNTNMEDGAFAALILTIIGSEDAFIEVTGSLLDHVRNNLRDRFGSIVTDKSLGPANIKESTIWAITHGLVRATNFWEEEIGQREYFDLCADYNLKPLYIQPKTVFEPDQIYAATVGELMNQNMEYTIDLVGANIQQGAMYANLKAPDEEIGPFNFIMWHNTGLILNDEINTTGPGQEGHENRFVWKSVIETAFPVSMQVLIDAIPTSYRGTLFKYSQGEAYFNVDR